MTRDDWHGNPNDDACLTRPHIASLRQRIWIKCNGCCLEETVEPRAFAAFHGIDEVKPLLSISPRSICTTFDVRRGQ
jgi:hypothetical protein